MKLGARGICRDSGTFALIRAYLLPLTKSADNEQYA